MFMDHADNVQRTIDSELIEPVKVRAFDGTPLGLARPGARWLANDRLRLDAASAAADARAAYDSLKAEEWMDASPEERLAEAKRSAALSGPMRGNSDPSDPLYQRFRAAQSARPFEHEPEDGDEPDEGDDEADRIVRQTQTGHEGTRRMDVPDADRMRQHRARMEELIRARTPPTQPPTGKMMTELRNTAYHESGHLVAGFHLSGRLGDAMVQRGGIGHAYVIMPRAWVLPKIMVGLAGHEAEMLFCGPPYVDDGADRRKINDLAMAVGSMLMLLKTCDKRPGACYRLSP